VVGGLGPFDRVQRLVPVDRVDRFRTFDRFDRLGVVRVLGRFGLLTRLCPLGVVAPVGDVLQVEPGHDERSSARSSTRSWSGLLVPCQATYAAGIPSSRYQGDPIGLRVVRLAPAGRTEQLLAPWSMTREGRAEALPSLNQSVPECFRDFAGKLS
jgi:hypothetical protein